MSLPIQPGAMLAEGRYRVVRLLGKGGMGAVYEAENTTTHKRVAIKCLRPGREPSDAGVARLVREAKAAARIRHPHVVDVYDVVRSDDFVCLIMECLEGEPLSARLDRGALPVTEALALLMPILRAVHAAHRQGVIHRDIKPANIFLAREEDVPEPVPKLLDFGVSKLASTGVDSIDLTLSDQIVGTPLYMPLEQLMSAKDLDARADVYALGMVLYEALVGEVPFDAETLPALVVQLTSTTPRPPHEVRPVIPVALSDIVMRALARERGERTPSVHALLGAIEAFCAESGLSLRASPTHPPSTMRESATPVPMRDTGTRRRRRARPLWLRATLPLLGSAAALGVLVAVRPSAWSPLASEPATVPALPAPRPAQQPASISAMAPTPPAAPVAPATHAPLISAAHAGAAEIEQPSVSAPDAGSASPRERRTRRALPARAPAPEPRGHAEAARSATTPDRGGEPERTATPASVPLRIRMPSAHEF